MKPSLILKLAAIPFLPATSENVATRTGHMENASNNQIYENYKTINSTTQRYYGKLTTYYEEEQYYICNTTQYIKYDITSTSYPNQPTQFTFSNKQEYRFYQISGYARFVELDSFYFEIVNNLATIEIYQTRDKEIINYFDNSSNYATDNFYTLGYTKITNSQETNQIQYFFESGDLDFTPTWNDNNLNFIIKIDYDNSLMDNAVNDGWFNFVYVYGNVTNYEVIDIPNLVFTIMTMPFAFVSQAFNLTIFPNTPYQINISNLFLSIIGVLIFVMIIKLILSKS